MIRARVLGVLLLGFAAILACNIGAPTPGPGEATATAPQPTNAPPAAATAPPAAPTAPPPMPTPTLIHGDWTSYQNAGCSFQVRYPPAGMLTSNPGGVDRITLPIVAGTNLREKWLDISCRSGVMPCMSPQAEGYAPGALDSETQEISGTPFLVQSAGEGAAGNFYDWVGHSASRGGQCVSLTFVLHSVNAMNYTPPLPEFDEAAESAVFGEIMATFGWLTP
jgi:hypothetical protein